MLENKPQEDLEKKKKKYRKRDKLWKLLFPKNKTPEPISNLDNDQNNRINALEKYAVNNFSFCLDRDAFKSVLEKNDWDFKKSTLDLRDYEEAVHGILISPPVIPTTHLLGSENDNGTSCYIDALLFAMYISNTAFDPLLTYDISASDETKIQLQTLFRLFVNKLRKGHLIPAEHIHWLRKVMEAANWKGRDEHGNWSQEDASELFLFITEFFDLPYLPFQIRLFHGANRDTDDDRVMTDRMVALSIPENTKDIIPLETILVDYFYNNIITGVKRQVERDIFASPSASSFLSDKKMDISEQEDQEVAVTAWQVLELLPFYSASNEQGDSIQTQVDSSFPDTHMILPIVLKRYCYRNGVSTKIATKVDIPPNIDFNRFVNRSVDDPTCSVCGHLINWTLHFKSAVCHKGSSPYSGHYIGYSRVLCGDDEVYWLKLDDLDKEHRVTMIKEKDASSIFNDLAKNAYIIFYELDKTCHHDNTSFSSTSEPAEWMDDLKQVDSNSTFKTGIPHNEFLTGMANAKATIFIPPQCGYTSAPRGPTQQA
ncbi:cysteine proteinase [Backusella circina FSU 941]|nr:cysteine proteinase [Backusella circina FSU 941]